MPLEYAPSVMFQIVTLL